MNRKIISFALAGLFILLFIKNDIVAKGITDGFELWYRAVIAALFPYMLLGSIVINGGYGYAFRLVGIPLCKILRTGRDNSFCIVAGMLFGLPAGSVFANEMYENKMSDRDNAEFIVCCFNNISPAFIIGYLCRYIIQTEKTIIIMTLYFMTIIFSAIIIRYTIFRSIKIPTSDNSRTIISKPDYLLIIRKTIWNLVKIGLWIVLFSVLGEILRHSDPGRYLSMLLEITTGLRRGKDVITDEKLLVAVSFAVSVFGGCCAIFQTKTAVSEKIFSIKKYIYSKLIATFVAIIIIVPAVYVLEII